MEMTGILGEYRSLGNEVEGRGVGDGVRGALSLAFRAFRCHGAPPISLPLPFIGHACLLDTIQLQ